MSTKPIWVEKFDRPAGTLEYARVGYDSQCRFLPQVNLPYMFSVEGTRKRPVFYKQYPGNLPDASAFSDIVADAGLRRGM